VRANVKKIIKFRDMKDYKDRIKKMFRDLYIDTHKKYEKNVSATEMLTPKLPIEKDVHLEWHDCGLRSLDRAGSIHHECGRFPCDNVQRGGR